MSQVKMTYSLVAPDQEHSDMSAFGSRSQMSGEQVLRPPHSRAWSKFYATISDSWLPEILALACSAACSTAIGVALSTCNNRPIPQLQLGLTLNVVISVLATVSKSMMLFVVAACLGQMKWAWFKRTKPLPDLQIFEDASRGPLGAVYLLFDRVAWSMASIGAAVTLLALAFDPFVQLAVTYPPIGIEKASAISTLPHSLAFASHNRDATFVNAIDVGVWSHDFNTVPVCAGANCTWPDSSSVGWCAQCQPVQPRMLTDCSVLYPTKDIVDINDTLTRMCEFEIDDIGAYHFFTNMTSSVAENDEDQLEGWVTSRSVSAFSWVVNNWLTSGLPLRKNQDGIPWPNESSWTGGKQIFSNITNPLLVMGYTEVTGETGDEAYSLQNSQVCAFDLCLRTYHVTVNDSKPLFEEKSHVYGVKFAKADEPDAESGSRNISYCWAPELPSSPEWSDRNYTVDSRGYLQTAEIDEGHSAFCTHAFFEETEGVGQLSDKNSGWSWTVDLASKLVGNATFMWGDQCTNRTICGNSQIIPLTDVRTEWTSTIFQQTSQNGFSKTATDIAASLTKFALEMTSDQVEGSVITMLTHVHVNWF